MPTHTYTPQLGNVRKCYIGIGSTPTWTWLSGEQSNSLNRTNSIVETSDKSSQYQQFIGGIKGATGDVTAFADDQDSVQLELLKALESGAKVKIFIGSLGSGTSPVEGESFDALINAISDTNDNGSVASRSFSYTRTGAPTFYPARS